jgi:YidC/Oxa1 family membrane protein insertase
MSWFDTLLSPIMVVVAWIMVGVHDLLTALGMPEASGATWALSIVALVIVIRVLLIPLFVRQIRAARAMQMLSPELQAIQKKYKGRTDPASREAMTRETMALYQKHGTNPFSSCLPILAQSPIFFALFRVLNNLGRIASGDFPTVGPMDQETARQAENAEIFGAPISAWFFQEGATSQVKIVTVALIVAMSVTTFTTQKQLTQKNMPASAMQGPMAQQQKLLLYMLPIVFAVSGVNFPIGVLIYWTTTNLWSMGQQFYVIRRNPTPGSEAERRLKERQARKAAAKGLPLPEEAAPAEPEKPKGQRRQPVRKDRARQGRPPQAHPTQQRPGARPAGGKPATGAAGKPGAGEGGPKPAGGKPAGGKPAGQRPAGAKPASGRPGSKPGERPTRRPADDAGTGNETSGRTGAPDQAGRPPRRKKPRPTEGGGAPGARGAEGVDGETTAEQDER